MTASPTPPDFFAESANKSENHAESAYCSDHIVDADKMVPAGLPSEEEIARVLIAHFVENTGFQTVNEDDTKTSVAAYYGGAWVDLRVHPIARAILDLIRPAFEQAESERDEFYRDGLKAEDKWIEWEARALSAEAKLAQAVEALGSAKDEIVRTADDLSMHSPTVKLVEEIAAIIGQPALNSRAIVREAARAAARGEKM